MNLKSLVGIIKSGNVALGHKLNNLLTDNCTILEYTDDAVLFTQNNYLVLAKFNHPLTEAKLTAEDIVDNEIVRISLAGTKKSLVEDIRKTVFSLVDENLVDAESSLNSFCENYYHYFILKNRYPELFTEAMKNKAKGYRFRKLAYSSLDNFKSEVFSIVSINESKEEIDVIQYTDLIEAFGQILFLGKKALKPVITDAFLGNESLAETFIENMYSVAKELTDTNVMLDEAIEDGYNLEDGKFEDEDMDDIASEDYSEEDPEFDMDEYPMEDEGEEEGEEADELDVSKLSDDEVKELHRLVLSGLLSGMKEFVTREANDPDKDFPPDLEDKLSEDLAELEGGNIPDDVLSSIEARWQPVLNHFLDSDMYKPEQELSGEDVDIEDVVPGGENSETVEEPNPELAPPAAENLPPQENVPGVETGEAQNTLPQAPMGGEEELKNAGV